MKLATLSLILFFSLAVLLPSLSANIDEYYHPDPMSVVSHLNTEVKEATESHASRRGLLQAGGCEAVNPIDKCWRCKPDWAENRQRLADCALGFAKGVTGGKGGPIYEVNDPSDDNRENPKQGTLRHAVTRAGPLWITFQKDMNIKLGQELLISSDKTIDGRGAKVHIANGAGITVAKQKNVIIHGIHIHDTSVCKGGKVMTSPDVVDQRSGSDGDSISVFTSQKVWIDHVTFANSPDGLIDVTEGSTAVTISNNHFSRHDKAVLLGGRDEQLEDKKMQVTLAFNNFAQGLTQRMPLIRYGFAHVVNNNYVQWKAYAVGGLLAPTILCQGNRFEAGPQKAICKRMKSTQGEAISYEESKNWIWKSEDDLFLNGAFFNASGEGKQIAPNNMAQVFKPAPGAEVEKLVKDAGALVCKPGTPC